MKKVFGLLAITALMVSCSDDDSSSSVNEATLTAGKWYYSTYKTAAAGQVLDEGNYTHDCATSKDYISLTNGTFTIGEHDSDCNEYKDEVTYTLSGKTLTVDYGDGDTEVYTVTSLSTSKLVLESSETFGDATFKYTDTYTAN